MNLDTSLPFTPTFMFGVYLATRGLADSCMIADGPPCGVAIPTFYFGNHDWLYPANAFPNATFRYSHKTLQDMATGDDKSAWSALQAASQLEGIRTLFLVQNATLAMLGASQRALAEAVELKLGLPIIDLPAKEFHADWTVGYQDTLLRLAERVPLNPTRKTVANRVAIVGYFFDRHEGDHQGNLMELTRLLRGLGLDVCSIWLSGNDWDALRAVEEASYILSFPHGSRAAKVLAKRLNVPCLPVPIPIGIAATEHFLRTIGQAVGKGEETEAFIMQEERSVLNRASFLQPRWLQDRRIAISTDPFYLAPLAEFFAFMGSEIVALSTHAIQCSDKAMLEERFNVPVHLRNTLRSTREFLEKAKPVHLSVGDSMSSAIANEMGISTMEIGFPSFFTHFLLDSPFMGYRGFLGLVERAVRSQLYGAFVRHEEIGPNPHLDLP